MKITPSENDIDILRYVVGIVFIGRDFAVSVKTFNSSLHITVT